MAGGVEFEEDSFLTNRPKPASAPSHSGAGAGAFSAGRPEYSAGAYQRFAAQQEIKAGSGMQRWLMRHHLASSPRVAQIVLIGIVILNIIITIIVISSVL